MVQMSDVLEGLNIGLFTFFECLSIVVENVIEIVSEISFILQILWI
jgi:hypothetical protein